MSPGHPLGFPFWVNLSRSYGDLIGQLGKRRIFSPKWFSVWIIDKWPECHDWWIVPRWGSLGMDDLENKLVPAISPISTLLRDYGQNEDLSRNEAFVALLPCSLVDQATILVVCSP
jgi:hypothetical protein